MKKVLLFLILAMPTALALRAQSKIAHVNSQQLLDALPSRQKAIAEMKEIERKSTEELTALENNIQKEYYGYLARKESQTPTVNQYEEGRIAQMQSQLTTRQEELQKNLDAMSKEINDKIILLVKEAVAIVAERKGLEYVIDETSTLFARGPNITQEVLVELLRIDAEKNK